MGGTKGGMLQTQYGQSNVQWNGFIGNGEALSTITKAILGAISHKFILGYNSDIVEVFALLVTLR